MAADDAAASSIQVSGIARAERTAIFAHTEDIAIIAQIMIFGGKRMYRGNRRSCMCRTVRGSNSSGENQSEAPIVVMASSAEMLV
jgi:hypothetical protein